VKENNEFSTQTPTLYGMIINSYFWPGIELWCFS